MDSDITRPSFILSELPRKKTKNHIKRQFRTGISNSDPCESNIYEEKMSPRATIGDNKTGFMTEADNLNVFQVYPPDQTKVSRDGYKLSKNEKV